LNDQPCTQCVNFSFLSVTQILPEPIFGEIKSCKTQFFKFRVFVITAKIHENKNSELQNILGWQIWDSRFSNFDFT